MKPTITTRRNVIKGAGAAGIAGIAGGSSTAYASTYEQTEESDNGEDTNGDSDDDEHFAAVRVGNLVPDLAVTEDGGGPPSDSPGEGRGQGPPSTPPGLDRPYMPTATAGDLYVGKQPDRNPTIGRVHYPTFGPGAGDAYLQVPAREYNIYATRSGMIDPLLEEHVDVKAGYRYTALAIGSVATEDSEELQSLIIEDPVDPEIIEDPAEIIENPDEIIDDPDSGNREIVMMDPGDGNAATPPEQKTQVSVVHASPNAGEVNISVEGEDGQGLTVPEVGFRSVSPYVTADPGEYTLSVHSGGETVLSLTRELVEATRLTVYITGFAGIDEFPDEDGRFGLSAVATIDGLNPQPRNVLTR